MTTGTTWRRWRSVWVSGWLIAGVVGCDAPEEASEPAAAAEASEPPGPDADWQAQSSTQLAGGACLNSKECAVDEYCATPPGECGREGVCTPVPSECVRVRDFMCSCDGVDYLNPCIGAQDKQNVDFAGRCPPPSCTSNAECAATSYCAKATGDCLGAGVCEVRPPLCSGAWNPVCGCNGKTYANACKAAAVGVTVQKLGAC